ncbi:hypothetical protein [Lysinibacillus parviboronicapiens]|uniref:hypothetical protein n=1 Tax=Lysinibacillus parviboronicapiens TaxID=436516 RepID=UPI000D3D955F|nr:hypothetical protein [Lysinibacillus parviboronicapiens]
MRLVKGLIGLILIAVGPMFIVITIDDSLLIKNMLLKVLGTFCIFIGSDMLHKQFHPNKYKKI